MYTHCRREFMACTSDLSARIENRYTQNISVLYYAYFPGAPRIADLQEIIAQEGRSFEETFQTVNSAALYFPRFPPTSSCPLRRRCLKTSELASAVGKFDANLGFKSPQVVMRSSALSRRRRRRRGRRGVPLDF